MFKFIKKILEDKAFGLWITDTYVQVIQVEGDVQNFKIKSYGHKPLPAGIVVNGEIHDEKKLAQNIIELLKVSAPPIKGKKCYVALPENQLYEQLFFLPATLQENDLRAKLEPLISETIPIPFHELKYDYFSVLTENGWAVFVIAIKREVLAQYYEVVKHYCGLQPLIFEPESLSLLRNLPKKFSTEKSYFLMDIHGDNAYWFILWGEHVFDSGVIELEAFKLNETVVFQDFEPAIKEFHEKTGRKIDELVLLGDKIRILLMQKDLSSIVDAPQVIIEKYRIGNDQFKIACGLALKGKGISLDSEIDFTKKM